MADRVVRVRLQAEVADFKRQMAQATKAVDNLPAGVKKAETSMGRMVQSAQHNRQAWDRAGASLTAFGAATLAGLGLATNAAMDWESAWTGVLKTVDGSDAELAVIEQGLRDLTKVLPASHQEIAAVAEAAGQLGISTGGILDFTKTMIDLGETTNLSAEEAATALARVRNIMGDAESDVSRMGATIVDLGNNSATTEREITDMGTRLAAAGKQAGLSTADVFAFSSALTSVGVESEAGGTAMSKVFTAISDAARDGGEDLDTFARVAGVSAADFRTAFETDAAGAISMFVEGMGQAAASGESTTAIFDELELTDQRLKRAILSTGSATGLLGEQLEIANAAWDDNSALVEEAAKRYDTADAKIQIAKNGINDAAITLGEVFLPALAGAAEGVASFAGWLEALPTPVVAAAGGLGAVAGAAALTGGAFLLVFPRVMETVSAFKTLSGTSPGITKGLGNVGKAAGIAAAAFVALEVANAAVEGMSATAASVEETTAALLDLAETSDGVDALFSTLSDNVNSREIDGLSGAVERLTSPDLMDRLNDFAGEMLSLGSREGAVERDAIIKQFEVFGQSLGSLVQSGHAQEAADQFDTLAAAWVDGGGELEDLEALLPAYTDALAGAENEQKLAAESASGLAEGMAEITPEAQAAADALGEWQDMVADSMTSFVDLGGAYDTVAAAAEESGASVEQVTTDWIAELEKQVAAQGNWATNIETLSQRVNDTLTGGMRDTANEMIDELIEMGPEGAAAVEAMKNMSDAELQRMVELYGQKGAAAAAKLTREVEEHRAPKMKDVILKADTSQVYAAVDKAIRDNSGRVIWLDTKGRTSSVSGGTGNKNAMAGGGPVYGPGTSTSDSIAARLSDGEYVIKAAAVSRYGKATFDELNAMRFAEGGYASRSSAPAVSSGGGGLTVEVGSVVAADPQAAMRSLRNELAWAMAGAR